MILSGTIVRDTIQKNLAATLAEKAARVSDFRMPELAIISVGADDASERYIGQKKKMGESLGIPVHHRACAADISQDQLYAVIDSYNTDPAITGIIVQLPLPDHLNRRATLDRIDWKKDVDGLSTTQAGLLYTHAPHALVPATAQGIISLLEHYDIPLAGKHVVVIGRSELVGKPVSLLVLKKNATVTITHSHTSQLEDIARSADILVVASGVRGLVKRNFVREGQTVIDVGIHRTENGLSGDVDFEAVTDVVANITPVPGGVGPLTVVSLFQNVCQAQEIQKEMQSVV